MTLLVVDVDVDVSVVSELMPMVGFVISVIQVGTSTVVVNVFRAVSVMTLVTVRMTVRTIVTLSGSSGGVVVLGVASGGVVVVGVASVGALSVSVAGQYVQGVLFLQKR